MYYGNFYFFFIFKYSKILQNLEKKIKIFRIKKRNLFKKIKKNKNFKNKTNKIL